MEVNGRFLKDTFLWGAALWALGYVLGIILYMFVPAPIIGWIITPFACIIAVWVLLKKIRSQSLKYYFMIGIIWAALAIILDYFFIVKIFLPIDGYYKFDVYLYYFLMFLLPLIVGWQKQKRPWKETGRVQL